VFAFVKEFEIQSGHTLGGKYFRVK